MESEEFWFAIVIAILGGGLIAVVVNLWTIYSKATGLLYAPWRAFLSAYVIIYDIRFNEEAIYDFIDTIFMRDNTNELLKNPLTNPSTKKIISALYNHFFQIGSYLNIPYDARVERSQSAPIEVTYSDGEKRVLTDSDLVQMGYIFPSKTYRSAKHYIVYNLYSIWIEMKSLATRLTYRQFFTFNEMHEIHMIAGNRRKFPEHWEKF